MTDFEDDEELDLTEDDSDFSDDDDEPLELDSLDDDE